MALPICLTVVILPPLLACIISAIATFFQHFGTAILKVLVPLGIAAAYLAQIAMIANTCLCFYYSFEACHVESDPEMPAALASAYAYTLLLAQCLGFVVLTIAGLYVFEWVLTGSIAKHPRQLALAMLLNACGSRLSGGACGLRMRTKKRASRETEDHDSAEPSVSPDDYAQASPELYDGSTESDIDESAAQMDGLFDVELWK